MRHLNLDSTSEVEATGRLRRDGVRLVRLLWPRVSDPQVGLGIALAFLTALISGVSVFVNAYAVKEFSSPTLFATLKNTVVGIVLLTLLLRPATFKQVGQLTPRRGLGLVLLGVVGGSIPFVLFFEGLSQVGSGSGAFIHKTLFLWVAVLAVVFLRERLGKGQLAAIGLLFLAQLLLGGPGAIGLSWGVVMVLAATLFWAVETVVARRILHAVDSSLGATGRMAVGASLLLGYLAFTGQIGALWHLTPVQWAWGAATGLLLLGYVLSWYAALKRAPAATVTCVLTVGAPITAVLSAVAAMDVPRLEQIAGYGVLALAVLLFVLVGARKSEPAAQHPGLGLTEGG